MPRQQARKTLQAFNGMPDPSSQSLAISKGNDRDGNDNIVIISRNGDIVLEVEHNDIGDKVLLQVDFDSLCLSSDYFSKLLNSKNFQEGKDVKYTLEKLKERYQKRSEVPFEELPVVKIIDIGPISPVKNIRPLLTDFLRIMHGLPIDVGPRKLPLTNLANIAIVGDRFQSNDMIAKWARTNGYLSRVQECNVANGRFVEVSTRQRLLIGILFNYFPWVRSSSTQIIISGSKLWNGNQADSCAFWWELPKGVEEELQVRRAFVLETIQSLQDHLTGLYISKQRQCRLGYDTSPQCDSFQLGEFIKFLTKVGALVLRGRLSNCEETGFSTEDIQTLIESLRSCPSYQLDSHHTHCGPKKQFVSGLTLIESYLQDEHLGICLHCWNHSPEIQSWSECKRPLHWNYKNYRVATLTKTSGSGFGCPKHDTRGRDLFIAVDRNWDSS